MDRRESLKTIILGGVASGFFISSCNNDKKLPIEEGDVIEKKIGYGRTPGEQLRDEKLYSEQFFSEQELAQISLISDIIIPADEDSVSASEAGVPEFIEFIAKDLPEHQLPMRGGLMWLNRESNLNYNLDFINLDDKQRLEIIDRIAYPTEFEKNFAGPIFFQKIKNLVITGYFTSEPGIQFLEYKGNIPNVWDGVPSHILKKFGLEYDQKTLKTAMDVSNRNEIMNWDDYEV